MPARTFFLFVCHALLAGTACAQEAYGSLFNDTAKCRRATTHEWLYGIGGLNTLDTYLSPLEYTGPTLSLVHRSERWARWGHERVTVQGLYTAQAGRPHSPTNDHARWEADASAAVAWHFNWKPLAGLRLAAGGKAEMECGFTWSDNGGNNPGQGRLSTDVALSGIAEYSFRLRQMPLNIGTQLDIPLLGGMFSPHFGQSYYEIFSLGHYDRNVCFTHPFNAPSAQWLTTLRFKFLGATLSVGYRADIRQSRVNGLKYHSWNNTFVIGYTRRLLLLR